MKIFFHFSVIGFSNTYLVGGDNGGDAILIDPGHMDIELLKLIGDNRFSIRYVLLTHRHDSHIQGLRTLMKIYDLEVFANSPYIYDVPVHVIDDGAEIELAGLEITTIHIPGHSSDSLVYKIGDALFTGDVLMASRIGSTATSVAQSLQVRSIRERLLPLDDRTLIFPGHGTPTTLGVEKLINEELMPHRHPEESAFSATDGT